MDEGKNEQKHQSILIFYLRTATDANNGLSGKQNTAECKRYKKYNKEK